MMNRYLLTMKLVGLIVMFLLVAPNTVWAETDWAEMSLARSARPTDCAGGSIGSCIDDLLDEQGAMIGEVEGMIYDMQAMGLFSTDRYRSIMTELAAQGYEVPDDPDIHGNLPDDVFERLDTVKNDHRRAREANDATTDDEYENMLAEGDKEKGKKCKETDTAFYESLEGGLPPGYTEIVDEGPGNNSLGNGKCDIFGAYDLADEYVIVNERAENMCQEECKGKAGQEGKSKGRMLGSMQDTISSARIARQNLSLQRAQLAALGAQISGLRLLQADSPLSIADNTCSSGDPSFDIDLVLVGVYEAVIVVTDVVIVTFDILQQVSKGIHDTADKPCKQTIFGANGAVTCIPFIALHHVFKTVVIVTNAVKTAVKHVKYIYEYGNDIYDATQRNNEKACRRVIEDNTNTLLTDVGDLQGDTTDLKDQFRGPNGAIFILQEDVAALKVKGGQTNDELAAIKEELAVLKRLLENNRDLLLTPQGKREDFPLQ